MQIYAFFAKGLPDPVYDNYRKKLFLHPASLFTEGAAGPAITAKPVPENRLYSSPAVFLSCKYFVKITGQ